MRPEVVRQQKRVVLSEVSALLALLRRNAKWSSGRSGQSGSLVHDLKQLRDKARAQVSKGIWATPLEVMMPFLQVVKSTEASGPFTGAALKALLAFLRFGLLDVEDGACLKTRERQAHAVAELVDAVIHCRFEETDAHMDEVVKMTLIELLVEVVEHKVGDLLTDESVWEVVYTCFINRNEVAHSKMLCHTAEQGLFRIMRVVFRKFAREMKQQHAAALPHAVSGSELASVDSAGSAASEGSAGSRSYGLPCTVKIVGFLSSQLLQGFHRSPRSSSAGGGHPYHASIRLVCLRMIREALETGGEGMAACPPLLALVRDDLCLAILKMTKGGYTVEVLCEALALVRCLWMTLRRFLKMQFEVILKSIFLRLLHQIKQFYNPRGGDEGNPTSVVVSPPTPGNNMPTDTKYDYKPGEQQIILETLADMLAEPSVLPDLFFNYDCDTQRTDLLELLTKALADAVKVVDPEALAANGTSSASIDHATSLRTLCMDALLIILKQLYSRCVGTSGASRPEDPDVLTAASSSALAGGDLASMPSGLSLNRITSETWQRKKWKRILQKGSEQFNDKPRLGFKYLVSEGALQHLTPASVATFLRTAPGLDSEAIGKYLGEVGQAEAPGVDAKPVYVSDSVSFHEAVLKAFVTTFHFDGQPLITALRMFLAAFRLPGEAQQIDRVLQAFANTAFEVCVESASGIIASADVAYLLSFSIIMLNTDLHNVNIRPEKRMSLDAFIRNNKNYGRDISKGKDLPDEFLESIYKSISEHPIMPFDDSPEGHMTVDRWRDLIKLAEIDSDYGTMVVHEDGDTTLDEDDDDDRSLSSTNSSNAATTLPPPPPPPRPTTTPDAPMPPQDGSPSVGPLSQRVGGCKYGAYDREIIQWLWRPFLSSAVKSFVEFDTHTDPQDPALSGSKTDFLRQSVDMLLLVAKIASFHQQQEVFDTLMYLLCGFTGLLGDPPAHATPDMPWDLQDDEFEGIIEGRRKRDKMLGRLLYRFVNNPAAQTALVSAFGIANRLADSLRAGWRPLLLLIFRLRDLHVLPRDVLRESDADLLSPEGRRAMQEAVKARSLRPVGTVGPNMTATDATAEQANKGGMRWGGSLLNYLFSGGSGLGGMDEREAALLDSPEFEAWDEGARMDESGERRDEQEEGHEDLVAERPTVPEQDGAAAAGPGTQSPEGRERPSRTEGPMLGNGGGPLKDLRQCRAFVRRTVASCRVQDLVSDSRLLRLDSLAHMSKTLIALIHSNLPAGERAAEEGGGEGDALGSSNGHARSGTTTTTEDAVLAALSDEYIARIRREVQLPSLTPASVAFAEVMLAEVALRNRDRITTLWPHMLADHYRTRMSKIRNPTPVTEKAVVGLLRVCIRLFSREGLAESLAESLTWTLPPHLPQEVAVLYSPLLGAGVWRLVTSNPMALVSLPASSWKPLFDVIQHCAPCGGEATARAFEGLCYVLHEPQLQHCVPPCAVQAVLAFVTCLHSPEPLCRAALDLLMLLHTRLDLLAPSTDGMVTANAGPITMPDAWVSSWGCTLEALATAARDPRLGVRCHALSLLTEALLDKQSKRVGATHISRFLADVAIPLAKSTHTSQAAAAIPNNTGMKKGADYKVGTPPARTPGMGAQASAFKARELALSLVSQPFLQHLRDLLLLQTFHELWLKVLEVMEVYLADAPPASSLDLEAPQAQQGVTAVGTPSSEMAPLSELALEKLKNMLLVMAASGAFEPGEDTIGKELWELTWAVIENFKFCPKLKEDLFGTEQQQQQAPEQPQQPPPPPHQQQQYQLEGSSDSDSNQVSPGPNPFVAAEVVSTA